MVTSTAAERSNPYKIQLVETSPFHCVSVEVTKLDYLSTKWVISTIAEKSHLLNSNLFLAAYQDTLQASRHTPYIYFPLA